MWDSKSYISFLNEHNSSIVNIIKQPTLKGIVSQDQLFFEGLTNQIYSFCKCADGL
jgi:hypothetical protein